MNAAAAATALRMLAAAIEEGPASDRASSGTPAVLSAKEAADFLGLSPSTITQHVKAGHLKATRYGRRAVRIQRDDLERFRDSRLIS